MGVVLFLTGATGHLGPHLLAELAVTDTIEQVTVLTRARDGAAPSAFHGAVGAAHALSRTLRARGSPPAPAIPVTGDLTAVGLGIAARERLALADRVRVIVHAGADTRFTAPIEGLRAVNVEGTRRVCEFAAGCRRLRQILFVSTTCVAGCRTGRVPEKIEDAAPDFVNAYEQSKWEAEHIVADCGLPARIARLSTCIGGHRTGYVHRLGAIHHLFQWMERGLVPMVPAAADTPVDIISTEVAAAWLARAAIRNPNGVEVCHVAAGRDAIPIADLLEFVAAEARPSNAVRRQSHGRPALVDAYTYRLFQQMVDRSGDLLFARVQAAAAAVLPAVLYPKVFDTTSAERCWGGPLPHPDWRMMLSNVLEFLRSRGRERTAAEAVRA